MSIKCSNNLPCFKMALSSISGFLQLLSHIQYKWLYLKGFLVFSPKMRKKQKLKKKPNRSSSPATIFIVSGNDKPHPRTTHPFVTPSPPLFLTKLSLFCLSLTQFELLLLCTQIVQLIVCEKMDCKVDIEVGSRPLYPMMLDSSGALVVFLFFFLFCSSFHLWWENWKFWMHDSKPLDLTAEWTDRSFWNSTNSGAFFNWVSKAKLAQ